jgi:hypothetical protein
MPPTEEEIAAQLATHHRNLEFLETVQMLSLNRFTPEPEFVDNAEAVLRGLYPPDRFLVNVMTHLTDDARSGLTPMRHPHSFEPMGRMDRGDEDAILLLRGIEQCLTSGLTRLCTRCRQMEGLHAQHPAPGSWCPTEFGFSRVSRFSENPHAGVFREIHRPRREENFADAIHSPIHRGF